MLTIDEDDRRAMLQADRQNGIQGSRQAFQRVAGVFVADSDDRQVVTILRWNAVLLDAIPNNVHDRLWIGAHLFLGKQPADQDNAASGLGHLHAADERGFARHAIHDNEDIRHVTLMRPISISITGCGGLIGFDRWRFDPNLPAFDEDDVWKAGQGSVEPRHDFGVETAGTFTCHDNNPCSRLIGGTRCGLGDDEEEQAYDPKTFRHDNPFSLPAILSRADRLVTGALAPKGHEKFVAVHATPDPREPAAEDAEARFSPSERKAMEGETMAERMFHHMT